MTEVVAGAEAWSGGDGDTGVLLLHGFSGNPVSLRPVADHLAAAGMSVEMPRLPGHGTHWRDLGTAQWQDWAREAITGLEELRRRSTRQVVFGISMGGALALHLAATRGDDLTGLVLVNPWVHRLRDPRSRVLPLVAWAVPSVAGVGNDISRPGGDEKPYERIPVRALVSVTRMQRRVRDELDRVTVPLLVFTSRQDHVVDPRDSDLVRNHVASAHVEQVWLERSYHVATLDYDGPRILEETVAFIRRLGASGLPASSPPDATGPR